MEPVTFAEVWRGGLLESIHKGHAVVCDDTGQIVQAWGDPDAVILPRSSSKMIQALPLIESGAADAFGLRVDQLALSCASHNGAAIHVDRVKDWLKYLGKSDDDFCCGPQFPRDREEATRLTKTDSSPCRYHNNCSGKHSGFLTFTKHVGAPANYVDLGHPLQIAIKAAVEETSGEDSPGYGIDGCSAPNFAGTVHGLARSMAAFASAQDRSGARADAMTRLVEAMTAYPELVGGEGRACTELMRAMNGKVAIKTGAEAVFVAIIPQLRMGVALKIVDGATRASECAIAAILVKLGVLDRNHPATRKRLDAPIQNWDGLVTGKIRAGDELR